MLNPWDIEKSPSVINLPKRIEWDFSSTTPKSAFNTTGSSPSTLLASSNRRRGNMMRVSLRPWAAVLFAPPKPPRRDPER